MSCSRCKRLEAQLRKFGHQPAGEETVESIRTWARGVFGPLHEHVTRARALTEVAELAMAVEQLDSTKLREECADVYIVACQVLEGMENCSGAVPLGRNTRQIVADIVVELVQPLGEIDGSRLAADLALLCNLYDGKLADDVDRKMVVNRAREWKVEGGVGQHI